MELSPAAPEPLALPPVLQALAARLKAALAADPDHQLVLSGTNMGPGSDGVVALFQSTVGGVLTLGGTVDFGEVGAPPLLKVTGIAVGTPYDVESAAATCWFGVQGTDTLTLVAHLEPGAGWTFATSFFNLAGTFWDDLPFASPAFILSTGDATDPELGVEVGEGASFYFLPTGMTGPLAPALQLVAGTVTPAPFVGPLVETTDSRTLSLAMPFPDVDLAVGGVSAMKFTSTRLVLSSAYQVDPEFNQNVIAAESTVAVGGVQLPLAIVPPGTLLDEWRVGLLPGTPVPLPGLSPLLSVLTDYPAASALPADVLPLPGFEIDGFLVGFDSVGGSFRSFFAGARMADGQGKPWTIIPGVLEVDGLEVRVMVQRLAQAGGTVATQAGGSITGTVTIGGELTLTANVVLPVGTGLWTLSTAAPLELPSLGDLAQFVGGASLASLLPGGIGDVGGFTLQSTSLAVDPAQRLLTRFSFTLTSTNDWTIIPGRLVLRDLLIQMDIDQPFSTRVVTGQVSGTIAIGGVDVEVWVGRGDAQSDWEVTVSASPIPLPTLGDVAALAGTDVAALLPESLRTLGFTIDTLEVGVNLSTRTVQTVSFCLVSNDDWPVIPGQLTVSSPEAYLSLDWTSGALQVEGGLSGVVLIGTAPFQVAGEYAQSGWTLSATLMTGDPGDAEAVELPAVIGQFGQSTALGAPAGVGLPALALTSATATLVVNTGELTLAGTSALEWPLPFGAGTAPLRITGLGGTFHREANGAGYQATLTGSLALAGIEAGVTVQLGSAGTDTVITAAITDAPTLSLSALVDGLARAPDGSNGWSTLVLPADLPPLGLAAAMLELNLTKKTLVLYGQAPRWGAGALLVQAVGSGWQYAFGVALSSGSADWNFSQVSPGLAPADSFFDIPRATALLALSSMDGQDLSAIRARVPPITSALPAYVRKGANFVATVRLTTPVTENVPRILNGADAGTLVLYALLANPSSESLFQVRLGQYTLAEAVTFSDVCLQYRPSTSPALSLHGTVSVTVDGTAYVFVGDLAITETAATFSVSTAQRIVAPLGMTGITLDALSCVIQYGFPQGQPTTMDVALQGGVTIGSVANLTGRLLLVNGRPTLVDVAVTNLSIADLFTQSITSGHAWPTDRLAPIEFISGRVYYAMAPTSYGGFNYLQGFNAAVQAAILGQRATLTVSVQPASGITATGALDQPLDWGFVKIRGAQPGTGPSASLSTIDQPTFTLTAGVELFETDLGLVVFSLAKTASGETQARAAFTAKLPLFGDQTLDVCWTESGGFTLNDFPVQLPATLDLSALTSQTGACAGKAILQSLAVDTKYNFTTDFSVAQGQALELVVQGYFELTALNQEVLRIDLQRLVISIPIPSSGEPFKWSDIPEWITRTIVDNAYSIFKQVLSDPGSMAKLLAIEGVKFVASELVDGLVCEGWKQAEAESFVETAGSGFAGTVIVGGVSYVVGGVGLVVGAAGLVTIGSGIAGAQAPTRPGKPGGPRMSYTAATLSLSWDAASDAQAYLWQLLGPGTAVVAGDNHTSALGATVPGSGLSWGTEYTLRVVASNGGVLGDAAAASYTVPTPTTVAQEVRSSGALPPQAAAQVMAVLVSVDATQLTAALVSAYGMADAAQWATPLAQALQAGGFAVDQAREQLQRVFGSITPTQLVAALHAAYTMAPAAVARLLAAASFTPLMTPADVASALVVVFVQPEPIPPAAVATALLDAYSAKPPTPAEMARALVAAFHQPAPIRPEEVAQALRGAPFSPQLTPARTAVALTAAFPALEPSAVVAALFAAFTDPVPTAAEIAAALVGALPGIDASTLARTLVGAFTAPQPITPAEVVAALVPALVSPPASAGAVVTALQAAFAGSITVAAAAAALVQGWPAGSPLTPGAVAGALLGGWTPVPAGTEVAAALVAAFTQPVPITPQDVAAALVAGAGSAATPDQVAVALVGAFSAITADTVAQALASTPFQPPVTPVTAAAALAVAFTQPQAISPRAVGKALLAAFTGVTLPTLAAALAGGLPAATPSVVAGVLTALFPSPGPISPGAAAAALRGAFPSITPGELLRALVDGYASSVLTPGDGASAVVAAFGGPGGIQPAQVAQALVAVFTTPAPVTPSGVAQALTRAYASAPLTPPDVAIALVAAYTDPPIGAAEVVTALRTTFTGPPLDAPTAAAALVAAFARPQPITAAAVVIALRQAFSDPPLTPADAGRSLVTAFAAPDPITGPEVARILVQQFADLTPPECVDALLAAFARTGILPPQAGAALVAAYTSPAITVAGVMGALRHGYARLSPPDAAVSLVTAFVSPPVTATEVTTALADTFPGIQLSEVAGALVTAFVAPAISPAGIAVALREGLSARSITQADVAAALVAVFTLPSPITPETVGAALLTAFPSGTVTLSSVSSALVAAFRPMAASALAVALSRTFPQASLQEVGGSVVAALSTGPLVVAPALVAAFPQATPATVMASVLALFPGLTLPDRTSVLHAGYPSLDAKALAPVLVGGWPGVTVLGLAQALVAAWSFTPADIPQLLSALVAGFAADPRRIDPAVAASTLETALGLMETDMGALASALATQFALRRSPKDVAALGVTLRAAGIGFNLAVPALRGVYGALWSAEAANRLWSVYNAPEWNLVIAAKARGEAPSAAGREIRTHFPDLLAPQFVLVLASTFYLTSPATGVDPVGRALKAANYPPKQALAAMSGFYAPDWTPNDAATLLRIYNE
jgi:hypothetical protein